MVYYRTYFEGSQVINFKAICISVPADLLYLSKYACSVDPDVISSGSILLVYLCI